METMCRKGATSIVTLVLLAILVGGCDTRERQDDFAEAASSPPHDYTEVTEDGEVLETDDDDWRTSPFYRGTILVDPAFPNPVTSGRVTVPFTISHFGAVQGGGLLLRAFTEDRRGIELDMIAHADQPGAYTFSFSPGLLSTKGLHRIFVFDLAGELVSYGDVMVQ